MITKARDPKVWQRTRYFPIQKHWRKLGPIFRSEEARKIWHPCLEEFDLWRSRENGYKYKPDKDARAPIRYDSCDWRWNRERRGPLPAFWDFACHSACHWVADLAMFAAKSTLPNIPWRILTAQKHTTVWNGCVEDPVLFDINFHAIGVKSAEAMKLASCGRELKPGRYLKPYLHHAP